MPPRSRNRPTALGLSFGEEGGSRPNSTASSSVSSLATLVGSGQKRPSETPEPSYRPSKLSRKLPVAYYQPQRVGGIAVEQIRETAELAIYGEEPEDDEDQTSDVEKKPMRILEGFTIFDPTHRNEMMSLAAMDGPDGADRHFEAAGFVKAYYLDGEDDDEDEEEDEDDEEGDENSSSDEEETPARAKKRKQKEAARRAKAPRPYVWIETEYSWYQLGMPSKQYTPHFQQFYTPKAVVRLLITSILQDPSITREEFMERLQNTVDMFGRTWVETDLEHSATELGEVLANEVSNEEYKRLLSSPTMINILRRFGLAKGGVSSIKRRSQASGRVNRHVPANRLIGNPDLAVLKPENQNATHVTPRIAMLAEGLVQEDLYVVGPPPKIPDKRFIERQTSTRIALVKKLIDRARKPKPVVNWSRENAIRVEGVEYLTQVRIENEVYKVGDVILITNDVPSEKNFWTNPGKYGDPLEISEKSILPDFFWFCQIRYIDNDAKTVHVQWFEHGAGTLLQELAHPQELFYGLTCNTLAWEAVVGKVNVHWNTEVVDEVPIGDFYCRKMYDKATSAYFDIPAEMLAFEKVLSHGDCPVCARDEEKQEEKIVREVKDSNKFVNGFTYCGNSYHLDDIVLYYGPDENMAPANIGYIKELRLNDHMDRKLRVGSVVIQKVGRIVEIGSILPRDMWRDERQLFLTDETTKISIEKLIRVVYAPCKASLGTIKLQTWVDYGTDHYYLEYKFPTLKPKWSERQRMKCKDHHVCTSCWAAKIDQVRLMEEFIEKTKKLPTLDLYAGIGAYSRGLAEGSQLLEVTHAIEVSPSAAMTLKHNSPKITVYNQCANMMLRTVIKTWEGHQPKVPTQLWIDRENIPALPRKGYIKAIVAGFPCQGHSDMNMFKKANDVKNNLLFNCLSWIDVISPEVLFLENVKGFVNHRLNATQASIHKVDEGIEHGGLKFVVRALLDMNYQFRFSYLQAAHYGAPQDRIRFILVATMHGRTLPDMPQPTHAFFKDHLGITLPYDKGRETHRGIRTTRGTAPHHPTLIEDAIGDLPLFDWAPTGAKTPKSLRKDANDKPIPAFVCKSSETYCGLKGRQEYYSKPQTRFQAEMRAKPARDLQHYTMVLNPSTVQSVIKVPLRANADYRNLQPQYHGYQTSNARSAVARKNWAGGKFGRLDNKGLFRTLVTNMTPTAKQSQVLHPSCKRMVTVREEARGQTIQDSFEFVCHGGVVNIRTINRMIGNAVPPALGKAIGRELRKVAMVEYQEDKIRRRNAGEYESDSEDEGIAFV